jgi:hypothetical protein
MCALLCAAAGMHKTLFALLLLAYSSLAHIAVCARWLLLLRAWLRVPNELFFFFLRGCFLLKTNQVKFLLSTQIKNSPPLVPGAGSSRRRQN